ncbi:MAG: ribosome maturation factor [Candidatus Makaraimicrobium thalassicum]|nr:MAG: ribosome maturation factor [Candidatus Omnitrophota bacterium]
MDKSRIPERVAEFIRERAGKLNYELVDISARAGRGLSMEVVIDKEGGITLGECSAFNREVASWLDMENIFARGYTLDVCSPGLDRVLKSDADLLWAVGKQVEVNMREPVDGRSTVAGKLLKADGEEGIVIEEAGGNTFFTGRDNVARVKLSMTMEK